MFIFPTPNFYIASTYKNTSENGHLSHLNHENTLSYTLAITICCPFCTKKKEESKAPLAFKGSRSHWQWWDPSRCEWALYQTIGFCAGYPSICIHTHLCLGDAILLLLSLTLLLLHDHLQFLLIYSKTA